MNEVFGEREVQLELDPWYFEARGEVEKGKRVGEREEAKDIRKGQCGVHLADDAVVAARGAVGDMANDLAVGAH